MTDFLCHVWDQVRSFVLLVAAILYSMTMTAIVLNVFVRFLDFCYDKFFPFINFIFNAIFGERK
jgi:hypothetical protein